MSDIRQGFPDAPEQRIPPEDWDRAPWNRWTFQNVRQMVPTTEVWRGDDAVWELERNHRDLTAIEFEDADATPTSLQNWIDSSYTDGLLVTHPGEIVFEKYHNNMTERTLHLSQSMAKSVTAAVAGIPGSARPRRTGHPLFTQTCSNRLAGHQPAAGDGYDYRRPLCRGLRGG